MPSENCSKSKEQAIESLKIIVDRLENTPRTDRTNLDYLERNVLNYCWLLQTLNPSIDTFTVENLVGSSLQAATRKCLKNLVADGYATLLGTSHLGSKSISASHFPHLMMLCSSMYEAIGEQIQSPEMYGSIVTPKEILNGKTGVDLLAYLLQENTTDLLNCLINAIKHTLGKTIAVRRLEDVVELEGEYVLESRLSRFARMITLPQTWSFLLLAYPSNTALDTNTVNEIRSFLSDVRIILYRKDREQYPAIHSLLVTPAIDNQQDVDKFHPSTNINYMWAFSALRLIVSLEKLRQDHKGQEAIVAQNFYIIFDEQKSQVFSVQEAIRALNLKVSEKKSRRASSS